MGRLGVNLFKLSVFENDDLETDVSLRYEKWDTGDTDKRKNCHQYRYRA
jgi:hypothetical protein